MSKWRTSMLQRLQRRNCCAIVLLPLILAVVTGVAKAQSAGNNFPGPAARENNRSMDDYDRTINRMKNDAKAANERRRNLFPQINEDFQRIQVIHNEIVRMLKPENTLNYDRLAELTDDLKKRSSRLRENLALPEPDKPQPKPTQTEVIDENHLKESIGTLHDLVVSFVANPMFKNLGVVDAKAVDAGRQDLENLIDISDEIKREAKLLGKSAKR